MAHVLLSAELTSSQIHPRHMLRITKKLSCRGESARRRYNYDVQGHFRSPILVPVETPYATPNILTYRGDRPFPGYRAVLSDYRIWNS